jgi:hypothetical protein
MQRPVELREPRSAAGVGVVLLVIFVAVGALLWLLGSSTYDTWGALLVAPGVVLLTIPALRRQAAREGDRRLFVLLLAALLLKLAGAVVRHYVAFTVYGGVADASGYHDWGVRLSEGFRHGDFATGLGSLTGTNFIRFFTGIVYTVIGPTKLGGFLLFSWLGFLGLFFFYRAYVLAVPEGRCRSYAKLVFLLPSLLYWPSSIGKEAWMMFGLGLAVFGASKILADRVRSGIVPLAMGLWLAALVRPHVSGLVILALVGAFVLRRQDHRLQLLAPAAKFVAVAALVIAASVLVIRTDRYLKEKGYETEAGVTNILARVEEQTGQGGSRFAPSVLQSPTRAPVAAVTVLFRPLLVDAHNVNALVAAAEGSFLLVLAGSRFRWFVRALGSVRRQPYVAFAFAYVTLFVIAFSAVANFGLLARERVQVLPLFLVLLTIPPPDVRDEPDAR